MKFQISLTDEMADQLLQIAQQERRTPNQQGAWMLEQALRAAQQAQTCPVELTERLIADVERAQG